MLHTGSDDWQKDPACFSANTLSPGENSLQLRSRKYEAPTPLPFSLNRLLIAASAEVACYSADSNTPPAATTETIRFLVNAFMPPETAKRQVRVIILLW